MSDEGPSPPGGCVGEGFGQTAVVVWLVHETPSVTRVTTAATARTRPVWQGQPPRVAALSASLKERGRVNGFQARLLR
jgi:hypothetical protein